MVTYQAGLASPPTPNRFVQLDEDVFLNLDHVSRVSFHPPYTTESTDTLARVTVTFASGHREHYAGDVAEYLHDALKRLAYANSPYAWCADDMAAA